MVSLSSTISILGCGWLGLPLAETLVRQRYTVKGSTTSKDKLIRLSSKNIDPYLFTISEEALSLNQAFFDTDILYINVPPGRRRENVNQLYPSEIALVIRAAEINNVRRVVFISSTGVYPNNSQVISENVTTSNSASASAHGLIHAETIVKNCALDWTIIRMAGLAGPNREPGRWFAGKQDIPNGLAPVNMIHLKDAIGVSVKVIEDDRSIRQIYNACSDGHPTKVEFYQAQAAKLSLEKPKFLEELKEYKIISNAKIKEELNYQFFYSDPTQF